jgi:hypothetical protein
MTELFSCKFQTKQGDYAADQALYTVEAKSYEPNGYNLYNMAGMFQNGQTLLTTLTHMNMSSMNPNVLDASNKR